MKSLHSCAASEVCKLPFVILVLALNVSSSLSEVICCCWFFFLSFCFVLWLCFCWFAFALGGSKWFHYLNWNPGLVTKYYLWVVSGEKGYPAANRGRYMYQSIFIQTGVSTLLIMGSLFSNQQHILHEVYKHKTRLCTEWLINFMTKPYETLAQHLSE